MFIEPVMILILAEMAVAVGPRRVERGAAAACRPRGSGSGCGSSFRWVLVGLDVDVRGLHVERADHDAVDQLLDLGAEASTSAMSDLSSCLLASWSSPVPAAACSCSS